MGTSGRMIKIIVTHDSSQHELCLPAESTFGDVKRLLAHKTGLEPKEQRFIFRGKEKQDEEHLHLEGVKDNSEIFLFQDAASKERNLEEIRKKFDMLKASEAVAAVRAEVDQLSERMAALEVAVIGGTKVAENEFHTLSELLMRQLLKLDTIEAEGEARLQRKAEVRRVQNFGDKLDSLRERNSMPISDCGNAFPERTGETFDSGSGSMNAPPLSSSGEVIRDWEQSCFFGNRGFEVRDTELSMDLNTSRALARKRGKHLAELLGAQVQEGTERGDTSWTIELEDPIALAQYEVHSNERPTTPDVQAQIEGNTVEEASPVIFQLPRQIETGIGESLTKGNFRFSPIQTVPAHASTSEDSLEEATYVNVGEILRVISPYSASPTSQFLVDPMAATGAPASVATNVAKSVAVLCELDDGAAKLMEIAFNKYPTLMIIRSDRRKTFIRWMFCSLSNLLKLLSTASAGTLDAPKKSEIEVVLGELKAFGFDAGFIDEMRLQVSDAWQARLAVDTATLELKTLCTRAESLGQEIASMERSLAAAKAEISQVEDEISTLCEFVDENRTPIFKWIE